ncbi:MAG TPA: dTDP-4-dehydrorhamnose reductase, partial [Candidatus Baltobacteraceae bacterium]|nr:dTDP-4-dehydrorhamnose reductase [Candidatus Baltobacteraceae bacterium]
MPLLQRVLIFGGSGQLGGEIRKNWTGVRISSPSHADVDITDAAAVERAIEQHAPDAVVNCAAFHNVERCESEPSNAFEANALAVNAMAQACANRSTVFVTISTDYVFDGEAGRPYTEADPPRPLSAYGVSKYAGELLTLRLQSPAYVVRTCGVYATRASTSKGHTFIDRIIAQARAGEPVRVVRDQTVSPTYAPHLAQGLLQLLASGAPYGVYHMVNEGAVTWYDYARQALRIAGIDHPVEPASYKDWPSRVRRPAFSALENAKLHELG